MASVYLGLGSNLGDREAALWQVLKLVSAVVSVEAVSSLYETDPVGYLEQEPFLNAVASGDTTLAPHELLLTLKEIERKVGRTPAVRWGPRVIDLDILSYDSIVIDSPELTLPHPRLAERAFVLVPLAEIAPHWRHPILAQTAQTLLARLDPVSGVRKFKADWWP